MGKHENKHTPGPWHAVSGFVSCAACEHGIPCGEIASDGADLWIAKVQDGRIGKGSGAANARLIAAAPELLAACKRLAAELAARLDYDASEAEEMAALGQAHVAIAKAEGREP